MTRIVLEGDSVTVGIIANTHGPVSSTVVDALRGCDLIVHAGDIGVPGTLDVLREAGRFVAIRGNSDRLPPLCDLPALLEIAAGGVVVLVVHNHALLPWPPAPGVRVVISGLWHQPSVAERDGVLLVSPGSGVPLPGMRASVVELTIHGDHVESSVVMLGPSSNGDDSPVEL